VFHDLVISRTFSGCFSFLKGRRRVYFAGDRYEKADGLCKRTFLYPGI
jgi:negative regulator of replication initiation